MRNENSEKTAVKAEPDFKLTEVMSPPVACGQPEPPLRVREYVAPRNDIEASVAEILAGVLKIEQVGVNDNLMLLGGESLLAAQAAWQIQNRFGCEVSLRSILTGTVANIAAEIQAASGDSQSY